ncbi:MAG: YggS family pyridoxal phosphate-dependent enzyme [Chloroherpetonaceae bacterium]|nr:YggS family pyridoxal phosphate-dependent enzyme [Chloroherpetonaceae bacterium]MCS7211458.1 YggS family pyridoxal phosphate-dependent enzyme [Chloroherpetonaceae bacterium]MDW8020033.1 YggS family pyridoxal phosphate-dependent enzyme [Chloroherpetonaceae bacterium]
MLLGKAMTIAQNLAQVRSQIEAACQQAGRAANTVKLVAVSKTKPAEMIREAYEAGQRIFGENYVQELLQKQAHPLLHGLDIEWHLIGHLQSNKVKYIVGKVSMVQAVDKISLAAELSRRAGRQNQCVAILLEVNISDESSKYGFKPEEVCAAAKEIFTMPHLSLKGLMAIGSPELEKAEKEFAKMKCLFDDIKRLAPQPETFTELSMGMSGDFAQAIAAGATIVRIGSAIFGER